MYGFARTCVHASVCAYMKRFIGVRFENQYGLCVLEMSISVASYRHSMDSMNDTINMERSDDRIFAFLRGCAYVYFKLDRRNPFDRVFFASFSLSRSLSTARWKCVWFFVSIFLILNSSILFSFVLFFVRTALAVDLVLRFYLNLFFHHLRFLLIRGLFSKHSRVQRKTKRFL